MQQLIQQNEHLHIDTKFICMKCDTYLKTGNIPVQIFTICDINLNKYFFCENFPKDKFRIYNKGNYKNNNFIKQIEIDINEKENIICMKCHNLLLQECIVHCEICNDETERRLTLIFDKKKYPTLKYEKIPKSRHEKIYIYLNHAMWNLNQKLTVHVVNWKLISICAENTKCKIMISTNT